MDRPKPATFVPAGAAGLRYVEKSTPHNSHLAMLTYGVYELDGPLQSGLFAHPSEESLLFCWQGEVTASVCGVSYRLRTYDVLYIPRGAAYRLGQTDRASRLIVCRAPADNPHPPFHARWDEFSRDERRIRHLRRQRAGVATPNGLTNTCGGTAAGGTLGNATPRKACFHLPRARLRPISTHSPPTPRSWETRSILRLISWC